MNKLITQTISLIILAFLAGCSIAPVAVNTADKPDNDLAIPLTGIEISSSSTVTVPPAPDIPEPIPPVYPPLERARERITKKPFGIYITPANSPVQPERFRGYHTGTDFEIFDDEKDSDVAVSAICTGPLISAERVSGYGGVAVQSCTINGDPVTVLYGHIKLASVKAESGDSLAAGVPLAVLGQGGTSETDGERKHLHLSIKKEPRSITAVMCKTKMIYPAGWTMKN